MASLPERAKLASLIADQIFYYDTTIPPVGSNNSPLTGQLRSLTNHQSYDIETHELVLALRDESLTGDVLDIACGTGFWTSRLLIRAHTVTAIDASFARLRACSQYNHHDPRLTTQLYNVFEWTPSQKFDVIFLGFWLSHVPTELLADFLGKVRLALKSSGKVFIIDHKAGVTGDTHIANQTVHRVSLAGKSCKITKVQYSKRLMERELTNLGWSVQLKETRQLFIYGTFKPNSSSAANHSSTCS